MPSEIELSIVIPTLNEENSLPLALASLAAQREIRVEIIVADGGSQDATGRIAADAVLPAAFLKGEQGGPASSMQVRLPPGESSFSFCMQIPHLPMHLP